MLMLKKIIVFIMMVLFVGSSITPSIQGNTNDIGYKKSPLEVVNIFGLFPQVVGDLIVYLSLSPLGWTSIFKDYFVGGLGLTIRGTYNTSIPPMAEYIYLPSKDVMRVEGNPFYFKSISTDLDGEVIEEWWKFSDSEEWVLTETPYHIFNEPGYYNVSLRVIDNDHIENTYSQRILIYQRTPIFQGTQSSNYVTIVGYSCLGDTRFYNWSDFRNIGSGSCVLPTTEHPDIGDIITECTGLIILQYVPNGVISGSWYF